MKLQSTNKRFWSLIDFSAYICNTDRSQSKNLLEVPKFSTNDRVSFPFSRKFREQMGILRVKAEK